ncbi:hypothetical protein [Parachryseolinea silvisoli]|jgi:hypothetical protein|uniref:hypothetical protein n=1 Tax=Parachryseolinea silvisoli TaxID=2873601 RepID=UPI002265E4E1|nr:hypothetical protein [Parachryseolinea silvisoli]MCD9019670.1 hypothetical protein [Parachryseolinea silvisoli]
MKDILAKEFLYLFFAIITAIPVAFLFLYMLQLDPGHTSVAGDEQVLEVDMMLIGGILGFLGVYLIRLTVWAVKQFVQ